MSKQAAVVKAPNTKKSFFSKYFSRCLFGNNSKISDTTLPPTSCPMEIVTPHHLPKRGIKVSYLTVFVEQCGGRKELENMSTDDVCSKYILPATLEKKETFVDVMSSMNADNIGTPTHFVSHAWRYNFLSVLDTLMNRFKGAESTTYIWFDLFCNNQHLASVLPFEWRCHIFKTLIQDINHTVVILEPYAAPIPFTRAWCLWELYVTLDTGSHLEMCMTPEDGQAVVAHFGNINELFDMLAKIDTRNSDTWCPEDKIKLFSEIEKSIGFDKLNVILLDLMTRSVVKVLRDFIDTSSCDKPQDAIIKKILLAKELTDIGKYDIALPIHEECVVICNSQFGENDAITMDAASHLRHLKSLIDQKGVAKQSQPLS